jgi:hypothetical protein
MMPFSAPLREKKINILHRIVQISIADTILKNRSPTLPPAWLCNSRSFCKLSMRAVHCITPRTKKATLPEPEKVAFFISNHTSLLAISCSPGLSPGSRRA